MKTEQKKKIILFAYVCALLVVHVALHNSYCEQELCPKDQMHIGCVRNVFKFARECGLSNHILPVNGALRIEILLHLNTFRNYVASGFANLSAAAHMPLMKWDRHLAQLATYLNKRCNITMQYCSNTKRYNYVATSQISGTTDKNELDAEFLVNDMIDKWFVDLKGCRMDENHHIISTAAGQCVGHYIPLIQDHADAVGCSVLVRQLTETRGLFVNLICNFSRGNVDELLPYEISDKPGSGCQTGMSRKFEYLCSESEPVQPNSLQPALFN